MLQGAQLLLQGADLAILGRRFRLRLVALLLEVLHLPRQTIASCALVRELMLKLMDLPRQYRPLRAIGGMSGHATGKQSRDRENPAPAHRAHRNSSSRCSAICTALSAAPLRMLSATTHKSSPCGCEMSSRMRPTNTGSLPAASPTGVG